MYSGFRHVIFPFAYGAFTLSGRLSQNLSARINESNAVRTPECTHSGLGSSVSLAATLEIEVSFSSSGYLDVSVPRVPLHTLWIGVWIHEVSSGGFPHSEISGSKGIFAPPHGFSQLITSFIGSQCQGIHPALFCFVYHFYSVRNWVFAFNNADRIASILNFRSFGLVVNFCLRYSRILIKSFSSKSSV